MEDLTNPGFSHLIEKYQLDTIFHGETDEFKRIILLRHWIKEHIKIDLNNPHYSGDGYVEGILDAALQGEGFHCGHFARVQNGILNAYGYVTRFLGAGPGVAREFDGHHGTNEVWLNNFHKWMVIDAKYEHHFEKDGVPLSALEIRDEYLKNRAADVIMLKGADLIPIEFDKEIGESKEAFCQTFTWITYSGNGNLCSVWPDYKEIVLWYQDDFFKNNRWIRNGKPHWAYNHPEIVIMTEERDAIEWTPNTIAAEVTIDGTSATITLNSDTPNLKEYQVRRSPLGEWKKVDEVFSLDLQERKYELTFRTINLASVMGPEHNVVIDSK
ncbi:MAG: transglutaminase domain-containing protein [Bacteroidota bacterium]